MIRPEPLIFALDPNQDYAARMAARLQVPLAPHEERVFEDGEFKLRPLVPVRGHDAIVVLGLHGDARRSPHDKLCRLLFFCQTLRDHGARFVSVLCPYLCYQRKDRRTQPQDPVSSRYVAQMLDATGIDEILSFDVHNLAAYENAFRGRARNLTCAPLFSDHLRARAAGGLAVVVSPDAGGAKRAELFRQRLEEEAGAPVGYALMEKHRSGGVVRGSLLAGELRGRIALVLDDLISSGGTMLRAARACREAGAVEILAIATHALFDANACKTLSDPAIDCWVVADTVPPPDLPPELRDRRLRVVDSTALSASAVEWNL